VVRRPYGDGSRKTRGLGCGERFCVYDLVARGLHVPKPQPKRARLWRADGSCLRLRPASRHHVWSYDVVEDRTHDGRPFRILHMLDEYTPECLASLVARRIRSHDVLVILAELFLRRGIPTHIRSVHGPACIASQLRHWPTAR